MSSSWTRRRRSRRDARLHRTTAAGRHHGRQRQGSLLGSPRPAVELRRIAETLSARAEVVGDTRRRDHGSRVRHARRQPGALFFCVRGARVDGHELADRRDRCAAPRRSSSSGPSRRGCRSSWSRIRAVRWPRPRSSSSSTRPTSSRSPASPARTARRRPRSSSTRSSTPRAAGRGCSGRSSAASAASAGRRCARRPRRSTCSALFREMLDAGDRSCAMEATSHGSELGRLDGDPLRRRSSFTNLTQDHLDFHGTMEALLRGQAPALRAGAAARGDQRRRRVGAQARGGQARRADLRLRRRRGDPPRGARRDRPQAPGPLQRRERARGDGELPCCSGSTTTRSRAGSRRSTACPGASRRVDEGQPFTVLVDYAHTPDSLENVLTHRARADARAG